MGQNTSRGGEAGGETYRLEPRRDYYEVLGIDRQASEDDIKRAYRKRALELHPDRNLGNVEEATQLFAEVQSAYETLSDPQERAWYDSHRHTINGATSGRQDEHYEHSIKVTTSEDLLRMYAEFNGRLEFTDGTSGFFTTVRELFERLAREEELSAELNGTHYPGYATFGTSKDPYEETVKPFYDSWAGFSTRKLFSWKDIYRYSDAPDRRTRRFMDKENKRRRDEAIREFNDNVKMIVSFIKKRDPRYLPNTESEIKRQKRLREQAATQANKARAANEAKLATEHVPSWVQDDDKDFLDGKISSEAESDEVVEEYECVVCRKSFKSEKQFEAHEKSKKHLKAVQTLDRRSRKENATMKVGSAANESKDEIVVTPESTDMINTREPEEGSAAYDESDQNGSPRVEATNPQEAQPANCSSATEGSSDGEYAPRKVVEKRFSSHTLRSGEDDRLDADRSINEISLDHDTSDVEPAPKIGKAKQKRAKKQERQQDFKSKSSDFGCSACRAVFSSRSQLFKHINKLGHAKPP